MDKIKQVEDLKKALELEKLVSTKTDELETLNNERFRQAPTKPQKQTITPNYPEIKPKIIESIKAIEQSKLIVIVVCLLMLFPVGVFMLLKEFKNGRANAINMVKNSSEYKSQCANIDKEISKKQAEADLKYKNDLAEYENVLMPQYKTEFEIWKNKHTAEIAEVENILNKAKKELSLHYEETKIIPLQYRTIPALQYVYDMVATSDYDIKQAIDAYDKNEQRKLDMERLEEQRRLTEQQKTANELAAVNASLLQEQNEIAEKARRDANRAAVVGAIQRHNFNKKFK